MKNQKTFLLLGIIALGWGSMSCAQDKKTQDQKIPARFALQFQLVKTDGSQILLVQEVPDPNKKAREQQYVVKVPVTKTIIKDGKSVTVTEFVSETRVRVVVPTIRKSVPVQKFHVLRNLAGEKIETPQLLGKLGMGEGKMVVQVFPNQTLPSEIKKLLGKDTIFMHHELGSKK